MSCAVLLRTNGRDRFSKWEANKRTSTLSSTKLFIISWLVFAGAPQRRRACGRCVRMFLVRRTSNRTATVLDAIAPKSRPPVARMACQCCTLVSVSSGQFSNARQAGSLSPPLSTELACQVVKIICQAVKLAQTNLQETCLNLLHKLV